MTEARIFRTGTLRRLTDERFRQHFRALTGVSPLRYQKQLRLQEARQLMLNEPRRGERRRARGIREPVAIQSRVRGLFGAPPQRDVTRMRLAPVLAAVGARRAARPTADIKGPRRRSTQTALASR